jgi:hypothetical protein
MSVAEATAPGDAILSRVWTEPVVARLALGAIALHVVDDSFLQPEPGTSPADHLVGGLVPLAFVTWVALRYTRFRAGAQAALAFVVGFFGVLSGTEAAYYTLQGSPSGDDLTGFAALIAGFVLLGLGAVTL